ncbi:MAG: MobA/MobL family protein [Clostridiales bacterium]|nr:MobA/MobL family protein [Clostridiales bacterium]
MDGKIRQRHSRDDKDRIVEWRRSWADACNKQFRKPGIHASEEHHPYADQEINKIPQEHMGPHANNVEKHARRLKREGFPVDKIRHTEPGKRNRLVDSCNQAAAEYHRVKNAASKDPRNGCKDGKYPRCGNIQQILRLCCCIDLYII